MVNIFHRKVNDDKASARAAVGIGAGDAAAAKFAADPTHTGTQPCFGVDPMDPLGGRHGHLSNVGDATDTESRHRAPGGGAASSMATFMHDPMRNEPQPATLGHWTDPMGTSDLHSVDVSKDMTDTGA